MKISTVAYSAGQGIKNIGRNKMFSFASIATMSACIFIFGLFFSVVLNMNYIIKNVENQVNITVFFEENLEQSVIDEIGIRIRNHENVTACNYVSADEAWESFSAKYFEGYEDAAEGFRNNQDNPLANSAHYEVFVDQIEKQGELVDYIKSLEGVRLVNESEEAQDTLTAVNSLISIVCGIIILILLAVSVFLISNTVSVGISVRWEEISIMKLIGATNTFVRLPFILEGILIGLIGAVIPLVILYFLYNKAVEFVLTMFSVLQSMMNGLLPVQQVFRLLLPIGLILGVGIGLLGSLITIHKHLKV